MSIDHYEVDVAFEAVLSAAMEATEKRLLTTKDRDALPDDCFGIIYTNKNGKVVRAYPLCVPKDKRKTTELLQKSIDMFHYCLPENKETLAKKIVEIATREGVNVSMSERNQIIKYVDPDEFPKNIKIIKK